MSFEQDTHHQHIEELEQHQKKKENAQFQQELDEIIARLENEQFQRELDDIIERLDQQSQQHSSTDQEPSSHDSITEEGPEQLYSVEKRTQTFDDQSISHQEENTEEQRSQNQNFEMIAKLSQEGQETTKDQNEELDHLQKMKENELFQKDLDAIIDRLNQASHQPPLLEKEASSQESVPEEKQKLLDSLKNSFQTFYDQRNWNVQEGSLKKNKKDFKDDYHQKYSENSIENGIKDKTLLKIGEQEEKYNSKQLEETIIQRDVFYQKLKTSKEIHEVIENFNKQQWNDGYIKNVLTEDYLNSDKLARGDLFNCKLICEVYKKKLTEYLLNISDTKVYNNLSNDELIAIYSDIAIKTNLIDRPSDIIAVLPFKRSKNTDSLDTYSKSNTKGSVVVSKKGIHIFTSDPDGFSLAREIIYNGLNPDNFNARVKLGGNLFRKLTFQLNNDDLKQLSQIIRKAVAANKDTDSAFEIIANQLSENNITQIRLTDVIVTEQDKKKLINYLKNMNQRFVRRSFIDIYKYYVTYDSLYREVVSKIEKMEKEIKDLMDIFSSSYNWEGWKYIHSEVDSVKIRYNIDNLDGNTIIRLQILGEQNNDGKKAIDDLGKYVTEYMNKKTKRPRVITYDKIRQTARGRSLLNEIKNHSKAMLEEADRYLEDLFPMIELSKQCSNRKLSQSGTRVLNDYRIMTGPGIDYDFFTIQNHHITNEVNEIKTKISYGIGYEISFDKEKFDNFRRDLNQEVTRRALILETIQKNILTRNSAEELPGIGCSGYLSQLLDIYKSSPGKGWKDILSNDHIYQFYNTRVKLLSISAGNLSTPEKEWENGKITSTMVQGDRIFKDLWIGLKESAKKMTFPNNFFVKQTKNKIIKEEKTQNRILTEKGLTIGDIKSTDNILAINRGMQRFQRGNENAGGTELFKDYLEKLLIEKKDLLGKNGLGLNLKKRYSVHLEYSLAKNNTYENFNYSIGAPDVVIKDAETNDLVAIIQLKGYSQSNSQFSTSNSFFQMIEIKLLTETTGIKTAFVHINETRSNTKVTGKLENVHYDWLVFSKTEKISITDLEKPFWHTIVIRQIRTSDFSENIFNDLTKLLTESTYSFDKALELVINRRVGEIVKKLEQVVNDILYNDHAQGFDDIILGKYFAEGYCGENGAYMIDDGVNAVQSIIQNNILGSINKKALREAFRNGQGPFQYRWNKTILIDCWEKQIVELLLDYTSPMQDNTKLGMI